MEYGERQSGQADALARAHRPRPVHSEGLTELPSVPHTPAEQLTTGVLALAPSPLPTRRRNRRAKLVRLPATAYTSGHPVAEGPTGSSLPEEDPASGALLPFPGFERHPNTAAGRPRILIVEDDERTARVLQQVLEIEGDSGWELQMVGAGAAALEAALQMPPQVVLLDIGLPDLDGAEVYRRLRANPRTADARVVFLTGDTSHDLDARGITGGVVLRKPFATRDLASIVRALLSA